MFDFPNAPIVGAVVAVPDGSFRQWDGAKWVSATNPAPVGFLPLSGGTLTGTLAINAPGNLLVGTMVDAGWRLDVAGTGRVSGNVLIGATVDAGYRLDVSGVGRFAAPSGAPALIITGNPGTVLPAFTGTATLAVVGAAATSVQLELVATAGVATGNTGTASVTLGRINGTTALPTAINAGDRLGALNVRGYDGTAYTNSSSAWDVVAASLWSVTNRSRFQRWNSVRPNTTASVEDMRLTEYGNLLIGTTTDGSYRLDVAGAARVSALATTLPAAKAGTAYTVAATDTSLVLAPTGTFTLTLPAAATSAGRMLWLKLTAAFAVNSVSANVVPIAGGAAAAAIFPATAGKYCMLQSDGTNWQLMNAN